MYKIKASTLASKKPAKGAKNHLRDVEKGKGDEGEEAEQKRILEEKEEKKKERERRRLEKKKRTHDDMVADFVKILEQMMNPRQAVTSFLCGIAGVLALVVGCIHFMTLPEHSAKARELAVALLVYGVLQILMATAFFVTCMQTSVAVTKGVKDTLQIVVGVLVAGIYAIIALIALVVGIYGFYKTLCLCSYVDYVDTTSLTYVPKTEFQTALLVFVFHIITIVLKCCCCK